MECMHLSGTSHKRSTKKRRKQQRCFFFFSRGRAFQNTSTPPGFEAWISWLVVIFLNILWAIGPRTCIKLCSALFTRRRLQQPMWPHGTVNLKEITLDGYLSNRRAVSFDFCSTILVFLLKLRPFQQADTSLKRTAETFWKTACGDRDWLWQINLINLYWFNQ